MAWKISLPNGKSYLDEDLTLAETAAIEDELGKTWLVINPLASAKHAKAIMTTLLARDMPREQAAAAIDGLSLRAALDAIERAEDDRPAEYANGVPVIDPKAGPGEPETTS